MMYFLNLVANITKAAEFLKYITPFGYAEGADIIEAGRLDGKMAAIGLAFGAAGIAAAYLQYCGKMYNEILPVMTERGREKLMRRAFRPRHRERRYGCSACCPHTPPKPCRPSALRGLS